MKMLFAIFVFLTVFLFSQNKKAHILSLATTQITVFDHGNACRNGTGFFYSKLDAISNKRLYFLVTNYHVFTGHPHGEDAPDVGDMIKFFIHTDTNNIHKVTQVVLPLYFAKNKRPSWFPIKGSFLPDIAVIPLDPHLKNTPKIFSIQESELRTDMIIQPSTVVTSIGYPLSLIDSANKLPIWKTGAIASEPGFDFDGLPLFLIDISGYHGMSGSPVFSIVHNGFYTVNGSSWFNGTVGIQFLGIFSGDVEIQDSIELKNPKDSIPTKFGFKHPVQACLVWKANLIDDIINNIDCDKYERNFSKEK